MRGAMNEVEPRAPSDSTHTLGGFIPTYDSETGVTIGPGTRYSLRVVDGDWTRSERHIKTEDIPLIDPRARRVTLMGPNEFSPTMNGVSEYPLSVITHDEPYGWQYAKPEIARTDLNICELHVVSATLGIPMAPEHEHLQGTYAGLATPEFIEYLDEQGYNAVSLLPVHLSVSEPHLLKQGRRNFWGYSSASFFALNESYAATDDPTKEFRGMVDALHGAGKEVILDVVYNHTGEGGVADPTYSYDALNRDNTYKLDSYGNHVNDTGTGNTLDVTKPAVVREIVESLRYYVDEMHVDGFRFDLAGVLAQGSWNIDSAPLIKAIAEDPVLSRVVLIAEPWAAAGYYSLDAFRHAKSAPWMAWNDQSRYAFQAAVRGDHRDKRGHIGNLSNKLLGYDVPDRTVNYVSVHDGSTLRDMAPNPASERLGAALVLLAQGTPQRQAGSEFGYSQDGDPDAYSCEKDVRAPYALPWDRLQDPKTPESELYEFSAAVAALRREHPVFRQPNLLLGRQVLAPRVDNGSLEEHPLGEKDVTWLGAFGVELTTRDWTGTDQFMGMHLSGWTAGRKDTNLPSDDNFMLYFNGNDTPVRAAFGDSAAGGIYEKVVDTSAGVATSESGSGEFTEEAIVVNPHSLLLLRQIAQKLPRHPGVPAPNYALSFYDARDIAGISVR
jgi:glycogen operon protein